MVEYIVEELWIDSYFKIVLSAKIPNYQSTYSPIRRNSLSAKVSIDGEEYKAPEHMVYNSVMLDDVPNFAFVVGYTNASWTLKADISAVFITKVRSID